MFFNCSSGSLCPALSLRLALPFPFVFWSAFSLHCPSWLRSAVFQGLCHPLPPVELYFESLFAVFCTVSLRLCFVLPLWAVACLSLWDFCLPLVWVFVFSPTAPFLSYALHFFASEVVLSPVFFRLWFVLAFCGVLFPLRGILHCPAMLDTVLSVLLLWATIFCTAF